MNPYRHKTPAPGAGEEPPERDDEVALVWVWLILGGILVLADVGKPEPWGAASSFGMLILVVAIGALARHHGLRLNLGLDEITKKGR